MNNPVEKNICRIEIPAYLDIKELESRMTGGRTTPRQQEMFRELAETALKTAKPVGIYRLSHARVIDSNKVEIDSIVFTSKVLSKLLEGRDTVVPFIVTAGNELEELSAARGDMMKQFYLDTVKTFIVVNAVRYLKDYVQKQCNMPKAALMNPGEIEDWYITEQKYLFNLFDHVEERIGVTLTDGGVMRPVKSRSGIIFPNESGFETCQLCTQEKCPGRRCKFEPELYKHYLGKTPDGLK